MPPELSGSSTLGSREIDVQTPSFDAPDPLAGLKQEMETASQEPPQAPRTQDREDEFAELRRQIAESQADAQAQSKPLEAPTPAANEGSFLGEKDSIFTADTLPPETAPINTPPPAITPTKPTPLLQRPLNFRDLWRNRTKPTAPPPAPPAPARPNMPAPEPLGAMFTDSETSALNNPPAVQPPIFTQEEAAQLDIPPAIPPTRVPPQAEPVPPISPFETEDDPAPLERAKGLLERIEADLAEAGPRGSKLERFLGSPKRRETLSLLLAGASLLTQVGPMAPIAQVVRVARTVLGIANYSTISAKFGVDRRVRQEAPWLIARTESTLQELEAIQSGEFDEEKYRETIERCNGDIAQAKEVISYDRKIRLESLLGKQMAFYKQGIDLEKYKPQEKTESEDTEQAAQPKGISGIFKDPEKRAALLKTGGKLLFYSTPLLAACLAPALAPALMAMTTTVSVAERIKRIRDLSAQEKETQKTGFAQTHLGQLLARYEEAAGLVPGEGETDDDQARAIEITQFNLQKYADTKVESLQRTGKLATIPGFLGSSAYFALMAWHGMHGHTPNEQQSYHADQEDTPGNTMAGSAPHTNGAAVTFDDGHRREPHYTLAGTTTAAGHLVPAGSAGSHGTPPLPSGSAVTRSVGDGHLVPAGPAGSSGMYHAAGAPDADHMRPAGPADADGLRPAGPASTEGLRPAGPAGPHKGEINYHGEWMPPEKLMTIPASPELAHQEWGHVFEHDGHKAILLDLDGDGQRDAGEVFRVTVEHGKQFALINWADIRGQDGLADYMTKHAIKVAIPDSGELHGMGGQIGHLVSLEHPDQYVSHMNYDGTAAYSSNPHEAVVYNFERKTDVVMELLKKTGDPNWATLWANIKGKLGHRAAERDWTEFVARSGSMASIDNDFCPEIQAHQVADNLIGHWHGATMHFTPTDNPLNQAELLAMAHGNTELAHHLANTSFAFHDYALRPEAIELPGTSEDAIHRFLDTIHDKASVDFSPETQQAITDALANSATRDSVTNAILSATHEGTIDADHFFDALHIKYEPKIIDPIPATARAWDPTTFSTKINDLSNHFAHHPDESQKPWVIALRAVHHTFKRWESAITEIKVVPADGGKNDVVLLSLNDGRQKQFIIPPGSFK